MAQAHYFLGSNSRHGFYSLYSELIDPAAASCYYILKSGPGSGKSSLMRRVATRAEQAGQSVEYIHCSGDPDSLDGIHLPARKAAIVDGTSPHVIEPAYPGVADHYLDLSSNYDTAALGALRTEIIACMNGYRDCYRRAYRCLSAAAEVGDDARAILLTAALEERLTRRAKGIIGRELKKKGAGGTLKKRFLGGTTCQGHLCLFDSVDAQCRRVYVLQDTYGLGHLLLNHLLSAGLSAGYDAVACPCPLSPERLEHVLFPGLALAFVTASPLTPYPGTPYRRLRIDAMADPELLRKNRARLRFSRKVTAALMEEAVDSLAQAKAMHDTLERLYNPHVDFQALYQTAEHVADELVGRD